MSKINAAITSGPLDCQIANTEKARSFTRRNYHSRRGRGRVQRMPPRTPDLSRTYYQGLREQLDVLTDDMIRRLERLSMTVEEKDRHTQREMDETRRDVGDLRDGVSRIIQRMDQLESSIPSQIVPAAASAAEEGVRKAARKPSTLLGLLGVAGLYGVFEMIEKLPAVVRVISGAIGGLFNGLKGV